MILLCSVAPLPNARIQQYDYWAPETVDPQTLDDGKRLNRRELTDMDHTVICHINPVQAVGK